MIEIKFEPCERVWFFNTVSRKVESTEVKRIQVVPTGVSKDAEGNNVLDGYVVLYETLDGPVLSGDELFGSEAECKDALRKVVEGWDKQE